MAASARHGNEVSFSFTNPKGLINFGLLRGSEEPLFHGAACATHRLCATHRPMRHSSPYKTVRQFRLWKSPRAGSNFSLQRVQSARRNRWLDE
jgi:hypothetical protein